ncbi:MAG TPA: VC0807 family protein [Acidimicrobiia bacterium]|nr:VC0807 family protein [Acidimicrobiia bacterium]
MLVADDADGLAERRLAISRLRVLSVVGRRSLGSVIEATVVPAVLFYVFFVTVGPTSAMLAALAWSYGAVFRRLVTRRRISGVLVLAVVGLTVRTIIGLAAGTFVYFMQPIATTVALALVFSGSLLVGRPVVARLASDFCPLQSDVAARPAVAGLFRGLTKLWAGVHLVSAAIMFALLITVSTATFVALKSVVSLVITTAAIGATVTWSIRTARAEQLTFARVPTGVRSHPPIVQRP